MQRISNVGRIGSIECTKSSPASRFIARISTISIARRSNYSIILIATLLVISLFPQTNFLSVTHATRGSYNPSPCAITDSQVTHAGFISTPKRIGGLFYDTTTHSLTKEGEAEFHDNYPAVLSLYANDISYSNVVLKFCHWGPDNKHLKIESLTWHDPNRGIRVFSSYLQRMPPQYAHQVALMNYLNRNGENLLKNALTITKENINGADVTFIDFNGAKISSRTDHFFTCWAGLMPGLEIFATGYPCENVRNLLREIISTQ